MGRSAPGMDHVGDAASATSDRNSGDRERGKITPAGSAIGAPIYDAGQEQRAVAALRLYANFGREVIYRYRLAPTRGFEFISRSCVTLTGYTPEEYYADPDLTMKLVHPDDRHLLATPTNPSMGPVPVRLRWIRRDGSIVWTEQQSAVDRDSDGQPTALEGVIRDITAEVVSRDAAVATQAAICSLVAGARCLGAITDAYGRFAFANRQFLESTGWAWNDLEGREWRRVLGDWGPLPLDLGTGRAAPDSAAGSPTRRRDGSSHMVAWSALPLLDANGLPGGYAVLGDDLTLLDEERRHTLSLEAAVEASRDSIVVTNVDGAIEYVNTAFTTATGYQRHEVIGQNPRVLQSGHQSAAFYRAMWMVLGRGKPWFGQLINRRKDGRLLIEEACIAPVVGPARPLAYVAVKRDVTQQRAMRAGLDDASRQRELLAAALDRLIPRETATATCDDVARILIELPSVAAVAVAVLEGEDVASIASLLVPGRDDVRPAGRVPEQIWRRIAAHPDQGPWIETLQTDAGAAIEDSLPEAGVNSALVVPLRADGIVLGLIMLGSADPRGLDLKAQIGPASQVATAARTLLLPHLAVRAIREAHRARIAQVVATRAFHPLFQPIVDLYTGRTIGFEALTRFRDGAAPAEMFAEAAACGMGVALERATLEAALAAATILPAGGRLALNVSSEFLLAAGQMEAALGEYPGRLILELTEHSAITDYAAVRAAVASLGEGVQFAVDGTGAGAANLRHLVELRPDLVKLHRSLIHNIDADLTRQALVVGLKAFASTSGRGLIAEGIETELERTTLTELAVRFGQGFLLGAPATADAWSDVEVEPDEAWAAHPSASQASDQATDR